MSLSFSEMPSNIAAEQFQSFLRGIKDDNLRLLAIMAATAAAEGLDAREVYEDVQRFVLGVQRAADRIESDAAKIAEHEKFVADVLHIRGEIEWLDEECKAMRAALTEIADKAPTEDPGRYDGDNHGDSFSSGWENCEYAMAQIARRALSLPRVVRSGDAARVRELEAALVEKDELIRLLGCWYDTECSSDTPHLGVRREMRDGGTRRVWILRNYWSEVDVCEMGDGELPKMNDAARKALARG